jgi:hypothetical protein
MNDVRQILKTEFSRLGFENIQEMKIIAQYPENMIFLLYRERPIGDRPLGYFIDFNFVIIHPSNAFPELTYITAALHLSQPGDMNMAWMIAERNYWRDDGPFPKRDQMIAEVLRDEREDLLSVVN